MRIGFRVNATLQHIQDNPGTGGGKGKTFAAHFLWQALER
jgi:hypothetical protein